MDFNFKSSKIRKINKFLKKNKSFLLYHATKLDLSLWIKLEQKLKKLKLKYLKIKNSIMTIVFKNSIFKHLNFIFSSFILIIYLNLNESKLKILLIEELFKPLFILLSIKVQNKMRSIFQLKTINIFSYKNNMLIFQNLLEINLKKIYIITKRRLISK